jgi:hypothetical protein
MWKIMKISYYWIVLNFRAHILQKKEEGSLIQKAVSACYDKNEEDEPYLLPMCHLNFLKYFLSIFRKLQIDIFLFFFCTAADNI